MASKIACNVSVFLFPPPEISRFDYTSKHTVPGVVPKLFTIKVCFLLWVCIRSRAPHFLWRNAKSFYCMGEGWVALSMHPEGYPPRKDYKRVAYKSRYSTTCPVRSSYVHVLAALLRISVNDFSTPLKSLMSGKKSVEQLHPSASRQTSALELLVFYFYHILLVYPCPLYYGMLILSCVHGACPTPPWYKSACVCSGSQKNPVYLDHTIELFLAAIHI